MCRIQDFSLGLLLKIGHYRYHVGDITALTCSHCEVTEVLIYRPKIEERLNAYYCYIS